MSEEVIVFEEPVMDTSVETPKEVEIVESLEVVQDEEVEIVKPLEEVPDEVVVEEEYVVPTIECPPDKVPGWLDEHGNPQGCVDNNPTPGQPKEEPGNTIPENPEIAVPDQIESITTSPMSSPDMLAETGGVDPLMAGLLAVTLLFSGIFLLRKGRRLSDVK